MKEELKAWTQEHHAECLAQLAVFEPARDALRQDPSVIPALQAVAEAGLSAQTRQYAQAAIHVLALSDQEMHAIDVEGSQKHVMLSYQWDKQETLMRINDSLISRGCLTWFDLINMKGSTMDAMRCASVMPSLSASLPPISLCMTDGMGDWFEQRYNRGRGLHVVLGDAGVQGECQLPRVHRQFPPQLDLLGVSLTDRFVIKRA